MDKINLNALATEVTKEEGGKVSMNIAQVKEVISIMLKHLSKYTDRQIIEVVRRFE